MKQLFIILFCLLWLELLYSQILEPVDSYETKRRPEKVFILNDTLFHVKAFIPVRFQEKKLYSSQLNLPGSTCDISDLDTVFKKTFGSYFLFKVDSTKRTARITLFAHTNVHDLFGTYKGNVQYKDWADSLNRIPHVYDCTYKNKSIKKTKRSYRKKRLNSVLFSCACEGQRNLQLQFHLYTIEGYSISTLPTVIFMNHNRKLIIYAVHIFTKKKLPDQEYRYLRMFLNGTCIISNY